MHDLTYPHPHPQIALETPSLSKTEALALVSTNLEKLLGIQASSSSSGSAGEDLVAFKGGDIFGFESKVVAVISPVREVVDLF